MGRHVAERDELARDVEMPALADALAGDPAQPLAAGLRRLVDAVTRTRVFVALGLEPTAGGGDILRAKPRWPAVSG